ncbi:MAG: hypothetical protein II199_05775 [Bacteroidaceae bacterium]|jgi:hypothetical protein|nr:hypothetical protein [Bacteroidaceae bacterium]
MLYRIKFISDEVDGFLREIKIDSEATFLDLNKAILDSCGYPDDQMTSFYVCDDEWERGQQITREDVSEPGHEDEDLYVMANTRLSEFIEDEEQKFEYVFDPFSERVFYLDVKELIPGENLDAPVLLRSKGEAPQQVEELDLGFVPTTGKGSDFFDEDEASEFYGDGDFNSDDLDLEGFEYSDGGEY